jgi:hypothetical protein
MRLIRIIEFFQEAVSHGSKLLASYQSSLVQKNINVIINTFKHQKVLDNGLAQDEA